MCLKPVEKNTKLFQQIIISRKTLFMYFLKKNLHYSDKKSKIECSS